MISAPEGITAGAVVLILLNVALAAANLFAGWLLRGIFDSIKELRASIASVVTDQLDLERRITSDFARRDDVARFFDDLLAAIRRVEDKLDKKADK